MAFSSKHVEKKKLIAILEAARWSPSAFNGQPWSFLVATQDNPAEFERMLACLADANQEWARHAPVLMISIAAMKSEVNGQPNRYAFHDVGQAAAHLTIQAMSEGLWVHQMAGIHVAKVRETYQIPEAFEPVAAIAVGYATTPEDLNDKLQKRHAAPRSRKPLDSFVFSGTWGHKAEL